MFNDDFMGFFAACIVAICGCCAVTIPIYERHLHDEDRESYDVSKDTFYSLLPPNSYLPFDSLYGEGDGYYPMPTNVLAVLEMDIQDFEAIETTNAPCAICENCCACHDWKPVPCPPCACTNHDCLICVKRNGGAK